MKAKKLIASILVGMAVVGFTSGCGNVEQVRENKAQAVEQQTNTMSATKFSKEIVAGNLVGQTITVNGIGFSYDGQNPEDGEYKLFTTYKDKDGEIYFIYANVTACESTKKQVNDYYNKHGKQYPHNAEITLKVNSVDFGNGMGIININGEI